MYFQIKEIVLWPKNEALPPRRLPFRHGRLNVISGTSRTGKSAIIPIIDYCLGSDKCAIPVKTVRDACSWFGVVVETDFGEKLYARREPGGLKSTSDMFVKEDPIIEIPETTPSKNTTADAVKRSLDELAGLTALEFDAEATAGFKGRPSFRDLAAFLFQPQNIVANPDVLFYKADTYEHREKLRTIFPYVLDAVTPEVLAKQHEFTRLQRELRRKQNELTTIREVSSIWIAEIQAIASEARELGLVTDVDTSILDKTRLIEILKEAVVTFKDEVRVTEGTISDAVQELAELQKEETRISQELSALRQRLVEMTALKESSLQYHNALHIQRDRLALAEWLHHISDTERQCPVCGNPLDSSSEQLSALYRALQEVEQTAGDFGNVPAAFDREYERVKSDLHLAVERLKATRIRREALEKTSDTVRQRQYDSLRVSRFLGNLEQSLKTYERIGTNSELEAEVNDLAERSANLEKEITEAEVRARTRRALSTVNLYAGRIMPYLDAERPGDPIALSINDLTITVGGTERDDYLWEIGSGSNWLSYHIAVSLALQQYFLSLPWSPVPSFVVYDQPSQVYFPRRSATAQTEEEASLKDEDRDAVHKVFSVLTEAVRGSKDRFQIIVLDHAADDIWGDIPDIALVEEWRDGKKLVPQEWLP
jgi:hypothetical protein